MAFLKYYVTEKVHFPVAYAKEISVEEAEIIFAKLCRHFKIDPSLEWTSGRNHCKAFGTYKVRLSVDNNNIGILCHELGHIKATKKYGENVGHTKKHYRIMKSMIRYCEKKQWFAEELQRRTAPKPAKPLPTDTELRMARITQLELRKKKFERKLILSNNKIRKINRQISALKRFL